MSVHYELQWQTCETQQQKIKFNVKCISLTSILFHKQRGNSFQPKKKITITLWSPIWHLPSPFFFPGNLMYKLKCTKHNEQKFTYLGPVHPIVVPKPPLSFKTTSLSKSILVSSGSATKIQITLSNNHTSLG